MSKWKYGLKLITCMSCFGDNKSQYGCKKCGDMGELWELPIRRGKGSGTTVQVGRLLQSVGMKQLIDASSWS
jgi:hypothetical protein